MISFIKHGILHFPNTDHKDPICWYHPCSEDLLVGVRLLLGIRGRQEIAFYACLPRELTHKKVTESAGCEK